MKIAKFPSGLVQVATVLTLFVTLNASWANEEITRVFIFGGQSNMVGSDSKVKDIKRFPPYVGLEKPQDDVLFSYCLGRENKTKSKGWVSLQPVNDIVGPELSFARMVKKHVGGKVAIIKIAAGGTHLGGDWNPDDPIGFKMYPLAMKVIRESLDELTEQGIKYKIEAVMWHQGENDMFNEGYMKNYGKNLANFLSRWRKDLEAPELPFFIGELCTKTIWGMDLRPRMYAISLGQKAVTEKDPLATYVRTSHDGVEIGGGVGLHYHYGTLGQLQHGENYAVAYLKSIGKYKTRQRPQIKWPYRKLETVDLYVLAGHRNMEGERAFKQELEQIENEKHLLKDQTDIAFRYSLGGDYQVSNGWEALGLTGYYDNFGPELSFAHQLKKLDKRPFAIAKFTHSGSQIIDWTPEGSPARSRHLYPKFISFIKDSVNDLEKQDFKVRLAGIVYHVGENDMSFYPYRKDAAKRIKSIIEQSRKDLDLPKLKWYVSQQPPTDYERVNKIDVLTEVGAMLKEIPNTIHIPQNELPPQEKQLVVDTPGIISMGKTMAEAVAKERAK